MIRIKTIASLVSKDASVIDIGTDHAYVPIYLYKNNITKKILATDISDKVLENAKINLIKNNLEDKIPLIKSDGFKNVCEKYDEAIIAGMGTETIKSILSNGPVPDTLIISSHNNEYELRLFMQNMHYKIIKELVVKERNKFYVIIKYEKGIEENSYEDLLLGKSNNIEYFKYLKEKYTNIYNKSKDKKYLSYIEAIEKRLD